jgi:hypothetical protein
MLNLLVVVDSGMTCWRFTTPAVLSDNPDRHGISKPLIRTVDPSQAPPSLLPSLESKPSPILEDFDAYLISKACVWENNNALIVFEKTTDAEEYIEEYGKLGYRVTIPALAKPRVLPCTI